MEDKEKRIYLETRLRNLKRKYSRLVQHADLLDETLEIKSLINQTENELHNMQ